MERLRTKLQAELDRPELARIGGHRCAPTIRADCGPVFDDCTPVPGLLLRALSELDEAGASATPEVLAALRRSSELEPFAFDALQSFHAAEILPLVVERLNSSNVDCRWSAFLAIRLLELRASAAVPRLNALVESADWEERTRAAASLAGIGDPSSVAPLMRTLRQPPASAQKAAAIALREFGQAGRASVPALEELARSHWAWSVRSAAARTARDLSGRPVAPRAPACRRLPEGQSYPSTVSVDGRAQELTSLRGKPPPGRGGCARADRGWDLFPLFEAGDTCVAGENLGEWGGSIVTLRGTDRLQIRTGWNVNPLRAVQLGTTTLVIEGITHVMLSRGMLTRVWRGKAGTWHADPFLELPGEPLAFKTTGDGKLLLVTANALDRDDPPCPPSPGKEIETVYLLRVGADGAVESLP